MGDTHELRLPDGRRMTYADHGDPVGPVVLECVGTPQSRLPDPRQVALAEELGYRMLMPDRPGFGGSDPQPGRALTDWPADAAALLDSLGVDRFAVLGGSGGGPYAVACGVLLADRVTAVALVAPAEPWDAPAHGFVPGTEPELRARGEKFVELLRGDPAELWAFLAPDQSEADNEQLAAADQATLDGMVANLREAFRQGADAYVEDHLINRSADWSGLLPRLSRPTRIWQGDDDNNVPAESTRWMADRIPGAELTVLSGAGHGLTDDIWPEIYGWLLAHTPTAQSFSRGA